jgi:hypothetical protein
MRQRSQRNAIMKKKLITLFILVTLTSFLFPSKTYAEAATSGTTLSSAITSGINTVGGAASDVGTKVLTSTGYYDTAKDLLNSARCVWTHPMNMIQCVFLTLVQQVGNILLSQVAQILRLSGSFFNLSIIVFVVHMKTIIDQIGSIYTIWKTIRDLANMFFIFILLYIAISTIISANIASSKKMLINVVLVALFINFSFFATGFLVDLSNMIATQFYNGFASCKNTPTASLVDANDGCMSYKIVQSLKLQTIYTSPKSSTTQDLLSGAAFLASPQLSAQSAVGKFLIAVIFGSVLMLILSILFIASTILIFWRFIELIIVLMFSPLAFAMMVIPGTSEYFGVWKKKLLKQVIFAPVYFMFLWVSIQIITSGDLATVLRIDTDASFLGMFDPANSAKTFGLIANYLVAIFLLGYSMKLANELGATGAKAATNLTNNIKGYVAKHTVGRAAGYVDKAWMKNTGIMGGTGAIGSRLRHYTLEPITKSKFGGEESFAEYQKGEKERIKSNKEQGRKNTVDTTFTAGLAALNVPAARRTNAQQTAVQDFQRLAQNAYLPDLKARKASEIVAMAEHGLLPAEKLKGLLDEKNESHTSQEKDLFREAFAANLNTALTAYNTTPSPANKRVLDNALANLGEGGIGLLDNRMLDGSNQNSQTLIQMASQKQYEKILENTIVTERQEIKELRLAPITNAFGSRIAYANATPAIINKAMEHFTRMAGSEIAKLDNQVIDMIFNNVATATTAIESLSEQKIKEMAVSIKPGNATTIIQSNDALAANGNAKAQRNKKILDTGIM